MKTLDSLRISCTLLITVKHVVFVRMLRQTEKHQKKNVTTANGETAVRRTEFTLGESEIPLFCPTAGSPAVKSLSGSKPSQRDVVSWFKQAALNAPPPPVTPSFFRLFIGRRLYLDVYKEFVVKRVRARFSLGQGASVGELRRFRRPGTNSDVGVTLEAEPIGNESRGGEQHLAALSLMNGSLEVLVFGCMHGRAVIQTALSLHSTV